MTENKALLNPEKASKDEIDSWPVRLAARGVVYDDAGKLALLRVRKHGYYKLPGGGLEENETPEMAFVRECAEETGCLVAIERKLGLFEEARKIFALKQVSFCFLGRATGKKDLPAFTDEEKENDFSLIWVKPLEALRLMSNGQPDNREGTDYIVPRDRSILKWALDEAGGLIMGKV